MEPTEAVKPSKGSKGRKLARRVQEEELKAEAKRLRAELEEVKATFQEITVELKKLQEYFRQQQVVSLRNPDGTLVQFLRKPFSSAVLN